MAAVKKTRAAIAPASMCHPCDWPEEPTALLLLESQHPLAHGDTASFGKVANSDQRARALCVIAGNSSAESARAITLLSHIGSLAPTQRHETRARRFLMAWLIILSASARALRLDRQRSIEGMH